MSRLHVLCLVVVGAVELRPMDGGPEPLPQAVGPENAELGKKVEFQSIKPMYES